VGGILQRVFNCFNYSITTGVENITRGYTWGKYYRVFNCFNYSITTDVENITRGYKWGKYYKEYLIVLINLLLQM
jgi:hypothetical protein